MTLHHLKLQLFWLKLHNFVYNYKCPESDVIFVSISDIIIMCLKVQAYLQLYLQYIIIVSIFRTQFTLKELQKRPLPEGVDPARLETYLSDEEFQVCMYVCICMYT